MSTLIKIVSKYRDLVLNYVENNKDLYELNSEFLEYDIVFSYKNISWSPAGWSDR